MNRGPWLPRALLGLGALVLLAAVISISVGEGGSGAPRITGVDTVQRTYGGIRQDGARLGKEDAPVKVTLFTDLQCAPCARYQSQAIEPLLDEYVRPGEVQLELRHFSTGGRNTVAAAYGAVAAGEQGRQWQYAALFLRNQGQISPQEGVDDEFLGLVAEGVLELDPGEWEAALDSDEVRQLVEDDAALATELRLPAGTAVEVTGPGGSRLLTEDPALAEIEAAIALVE